MQALRHTQLTKIATTGAQANVRQPKSAAPTEPKKVGSRFLAILLSALSAPAA